MFTSLFLAAVEAQAAAANAAQPTIVEQFGIEPKYIIMQGISFLILFGVLYWKGIKPTIAAMDERRTKIDAGLKYAEQMKAQLAAAQQESATVIKNAQAEANKIIEEARRTSKEINDRAQVEATERANALITKAQQAIELEHKKMLADARAEIARLVVTTTERVLAKRLTDADRTAYNEAAARELTTV
jgi:F-type H+-transporting ATPase subunit b